MTATSEEYTWERYYKDIFSRQKKKNNALAVELGEKTAKTAEYNAQLDRIVLSTYWKLLSPFRKLYGIMRGERRTGREMNPEYPEAFAGDPVTESGAYEISPYHRRLMYYEDYYGRWMENDPTEIKFADYRATGMTRVRESAFYRIGLEKCIGFKPPFDISLASEWILFTLKKGEMASGYAERLNDVLSDHPECVIAYPDEDYFYYEKGRMRRVEPYFKPEWSPDTLDSFFYFGSVVLVRSDVAIRANWLGSSNPYQNIYDLILQITDKCGRHYSDSRVLHIPQVLFHIDANEYMPEAASPRKIYEEGDSSSVVSLTGNKPQDEALDDRNTEKSSINNDRYEIWKEICSGLNHDLADNKLLWGNTREFNEIKKKSLKRRGRNVTFIHGQDGKTQKMVHKLSTQHMPLVSVLILSKDHPEVLQRLLNSFTERTEYDNYEFIIVDNGSNDANKAKYEEVLTESTAGHPYRYIYEPMEFNFSALCNIAASHADGEYLLFMNDDMEVIQKDWLTLMLGYATQTFVGVVGAKLLYAGTDMIQHIGVTSMEIGPSHKLVTFPDECSYYYGRNVFDQDVLGVTGACLMMSGDHFISCGGFDESFPVAYNDVELCMRLSKSGLTNIQCNGAVLYHYESLTRGGDEGDGDKWDRLLNEKKRLYQIHPEFLKFDPCYNPNLIGNESNYLSYCDFGYNNNLSHEVIRQIDAGKLAESEGQEYRIAVDFAGIRSKLNLEEPEFVEIRGWSFLQGADNSLRTANVILNNTTTGIVYQLNSYAMPRTDLERAFPDEKNIALAGYCARVLKDDLAEGVYRVGIEPTVLKEDLSEAVSSGIVIYTDASFTI